MTHAIRQPDTTAKQLETPTTWPGYPVSYYPPCLSDSDLEHLECLADHCLQGPAPAPRLSSYLRCLLSLEGERRSALAEGNEIIEVSLSALPCHVWSHREVAGALGKILSIGRCTSSVEISQLFLHLEQVITAEVQHRLDPENSITAGGTGSEQ